MGTHVHAYLAYGYALDYDDIRQALGLPEWNSPEWDEIDWDEYDEPESTYELEERIEKKYGLIGLRQLGDTNWDKDSWSCMLYVKSTDIRDDGPVTRVDPAWLVWDGTLEERHQLSMAANELKISKGLPGWLFGWDRG